MNPMKVEVGQYREVNKGVFKATFSLVIYPQGEKVLDCKYFVNGDQRWFNFPQKEIKKQDGSKSDYIPLISYLNKEYLATLKAAVLNALKEIQPQEKYAQESHPQQSQSSQTKTVSLFGDPPSDGDELPF
jgi:hypothetical protein